MQAYDPAELARAMAVDEVDSLDPQDKFKLSFREKAAVHQAFHGNAIDGADLEFYMALAKARRRLVVYVENNGERLLADIEQLYETARKLGNLDAAFRHLFACQQPGHEVQGPFRCDFAMSHWAEGPMNLA